MKSGYDQFFKKARENAGSGPKATGGRPRFEMNERRMAPQAKPAPAATPARRPLPSRKRRKASIPWKLAGGSFLGLILALAGYLEHEKIESFLRRVEISMISPASAKEDTAPAPKDVKKGEAAPEVAPAPVAKKEFSEEDMNHFAKLNERKRELDAREAELARLEAEIQVQKVELGKRMQELESTRRSISSVLEEKVQTDEKKVETLVQMYSNMKPQQAAKIFEEMDEDLAVEIIGRMKKKNAAEIMNLIKSEKAKVFAEKFAGYKRD